MTTGKTIALTRQTFVDKVMSLFLPSFFKMEWLYLECAIVFSLGCILERLCFSCSLVLPSCWREYGHGTVLNFNINMARKLGIITKDGSNLGP